MGYTVRLVLSRTALAVLTLFAVSVIIFWAVEWLPGDPATRVLGRAATEERAQQLRERMHLDRPAAVRYWLWLSGFVRGDWGESLVAQRPVTDYVLPRLRNTLLLAGLTLLVYVPTSMVLGIVTAVFRDRFFAVVLSTLALIGTSLPEFVVGILLLLVFAVIIPLFPPLALIDQARSLPQVLQMLTLPTLTLVTVVTAYAVRMMQGSLVAVMESEYVRTATLKGVPKHRIILRHALPNALGPALRATTLNVAWLIGGVVLVESVFNYPGLGRLLVTSVGVLDTPVIEAIAMIMAAVYIFTNLGADVVSVLLNPRLRTD